jgi:hypothetical protein
MAWATIIIQINPGNFMAGEKTALAPITINLDRSENNSVVNIDDLVQRGRFNDLSHQVRGDLEKIEKNSYGCGKAISEFVAYPPGSGLVYFIDGTRGAGKSTFLRATYDELPTRLNCLASLAYIDPSRIEANEIILLGVLKALAERIDARTRHGSTLDSTADHRQFRELFKQLAGGLSLFVENHHQLQYLDPELFLDHGLERARHSKDLRDNLHAVIDTACKILSVKALVLAFDDADTNSKHALAVLECIRNYLDTPRLVVLVTGDMELYSLLVRDHFFDNLGHSKHDQGEDRRKQRVRMVDHLEDQYLLKLFPIRRRLQLRPLWNLLELTQTSYLLTHESWTDARAPDVVVDELIRRGLRIKVRSDIRLYREFLLKQPLRSVLQVLSRCAPYLSQTDKQGAISNEWTQDEAGHSTDPLLSNALRESLQAMALGSLYKFGVDVDAIAAHELPALIDAVFELSIRDGDLDTAAYLRPQPSEENLKSCFPALAADVANLCAANPSSVLRYLFGGPGSVSLYGQVFLRRGKEQPQDSLKWQFRQYMGLGRKEDALNWARHATAVLISPGVNGALVRFGVIGLHMRKPKGTLLARMPGDGSGAQGFIPIKSALNSWVKTASNLANIPAFALSLVEISGSSNRTYASIFNVLGIIEKLLSLRQDDAGIYSVLSVLPKTYPSVSISCPPWEGNSPLLEEDVEPKAATAKSLKSEKDPDADMEENSDEGADFDNDSTDMPIHVKNLAGVINQWLNATSHLRSQITPSAVLLGKIWVRLYFSLEKVSDNRRGKICAASMMELFALCVVNAFYVEESDHHLLVNVKGNAAGIDRTNPLTSARNFYDKLKLIGDNRERLPLTYLIATSPLILGLLHPLQARAHVTSLLATLTGISPALTAEDVLCDPKAWDFIERSFIHGITWTTQGEKGDRIALLKKLPVAQLAGQDTPSALQGQFDETVGATRT